MPATARHFEFLYINASEGTASGGHAAIKFDDEVFHFQHIEPGLLRIYRDKFPHFRFAYGYQENRTIQSHRIEVDDNVFQMLRDAFTQRYLIQNSHFTLLKNLQEDRQLIAALKHAATNHPGQTTDANLELRALGYFINDYKPTAANANANIPIIASVISPKITQLKQAINLKYGKAFLQQRRQQTWKALLALSPTPPEPVDKLTEDRFLANPLSFAESYKNLLLNLAALDVLESGMAPRQETLITADLPEFRLSGKAIVKLENFKQSLFSDLVMLMQSQRMDWGYPMLVGMARLDALAQSIATHQLVVLDRFHRTDANPAKMDITADHFPAATAFAEQSMASASAGLSESKGLNEQDYGEIEVSANTLLALKVAEGGQQTVQIPSIHSTPVMAAKGELVRLPLAPDELDAYERILGRHARAIQKKLKWLYDYRLFSRNCVTEIFQIINARLSGQQNSERLLGGYVNPEGLTIIPSVAFDTVKQQYRVQASYRLPPYREQQIEHEYAMANDTLVDLSESNVLTSSIYHWHGEDAAFLFFTQDSVLPRPLFGSINLTVALGQSLYGMAALPWDAGKNLQKSLKGIAVSLPELFFFNIRKGSFPQLIPHIPIPIDVENH